uniref:G-protein coupled receptors family 1 profile domain-containing protein n=1 Tax=Capitella teleta TaxID=283909 RepID=X2B7B6_CAPTE
MASLGIISNAFTLAVIYSTPKFTRTKSGLFIAQQTSIDLLSSLFFIVTKVVLFIKIDISGILGELFCRLIMSNSLLWVCLKASTLNLLNIAFERYLQIVHPIYHRQHFTFNKTYLLLAQAWLGSIVLNFPLFLASFAENGACNFVDGLMGSIEAQFSYGFVEFVAVYLMPLGLMTFFYGFNLAKMFLLVSFLYIVCWTPTQLYCLLFGLRTWIHLPFHQPFQDPGYALAMSMAVLNLCVNPMVYACKYTAFRTQVMR